MRDGHVQVVEFKDNQCLENCFNKNVYLVLITRFLAYHSSFLGGGDGEIVFKTSINILCFINTISFVAFAFMNKGRCNKHICI